MPKRKHLTANQIAEIKAKAKAGWSNKEIAEKTGFSHGTVWRYTKDVTGKRKKRVYATEKTLMNIIDLRDKGWAFKRIAKKVKMSESAVHRLWHKMNDMEDIHLVKQDIKETNECLTNTGGDKSYCQPKYAIRWVGNELAVKKMDIQAFDEWREKQKSNDLPLVHPDKESSGQVVLWLMVAATVFILGLAIANV